MVDICNYGPIKKMELPLGRESKPAPEEPLLVKFCRTDDPAVEIVLLDPGMKMSSALAITVRNLLSKEPHALTAEELRGIEHLARGRVPQREVSVMEAYTTRLNGVMVCSVHSNFASLEVDSLCVLIDAGGEIMTMRFIHYVAPSHKFETYVAQAKYALDSIEWDRDFQDEHE
jgi:hypothetical protein